ncbi:MAG: amino acid ABC transporter permease [Oscillospiraceae bacterium]|nr:amino acid ABC transporter permease [Oscillospiraceae bacterium]
MEAFWGGVLWYDEFARRFNATFVAADMYKQFISGLRNTLFITLCATVIGCAIGSAVAIAKVYHAHTGRLKWVNRLCDLYLTVIRGTPIVLQLLIMYFVIIPPRYSALLAAILTFGINSGAYLAEIIRAGIMAIDIGQTEASRSLGLSAAASMRFVILPQAIKNILPAIGNEFIALLKETSVVGYITVIDLTRAGNLVRARTLDPYFSLFFVAGVYLLLVIGITSLLKKLERRLRRNDRSA